MGCSVFLPFLFAVFCFSLCLCFTEDTITFSTRIKDSDTLVSNRRTFRFGFFSPVNSSSRYVGVWFNNIPVQTVVWVANKDNPINDSSGVVSMFGDGNLVLMDGLNRTLWSTNVSVPVSGNVTRAKLQDSGNLVLQETKNGGETLWESFDHPCDLLLSGMSVGTGVRPGENVKLTSWKNPSDPSPGSHSAGFGNLTLPELFIWDNNTPVWRSGPWNGQRFIGSPEVEFAGLSMYEYAFSNDNQGSVSLSFDNDTLMYHFVLDSQGTLLQRSWSSGNQDWTVGYRVPSTECDVYGKCGQFASCNPRKNPPCECVQGFEPKNDTEWNRGDWTNGCKRRVPLQCEREINNEGRGGGGEGDGFLRLRKMKVPFSPQRSEGNENECRKSCLQNCSCTAYAYDTGLRCFLWSGSLLDMQKFSRNGVDLYVRLAGSELETPNSRPIIISIPVIGAAFILAACILLARREVTRRRENERNAKLLFERMATLTSGDVTSMNQAKLKEFPMFEFQVLAAATDNFAIDNKIGQGGFGPVYKGKLQEGRDIAVKRLSRASGQGFEELVNEVVAISKLQHRNLVRLLGCCIEREERMLVYEFMPKKSLDSYIFDAVNRKLLNWKTRFSIIEGICRGLLYIHRDSRLRIIHRDLKASNILLDEDLNPKISDFGLARVFRGNEGEANTRRVVGTYGYMSPEYAMGGLFSEKSDVFSLGVILLEIISGRRNSSFLDDEQAMNLLTHAWRLWNEDKVVDLADPEFYEERFEREVRKCIHIGLLCVQDLATERPSVSAVVWMLGAEDADLPEPKPPAFIPRRGVTDAESSEPRDRNVSINNVTITSMTGR